MSEFQVTTKAGIGRGRHDHILYLNEATGVGLCSEDNKHTHEVQYIPPTEPVYGEPEFDPMTGEQLSEAPMIEPGQPGYFMVLPGEDGHTHDLGGPVPQTSMKPKETKEEIVTDVFALWREARELDSVSYNDAKMCEEYYEGKQWSQEEKSYLEQLNRAALTYNLIERNVDAIVSIQMEERADIVYLPQEGGDQAVADILTLTAKLILDKANYQGEKTDGFLDAVVTGRGAMNLFVTFEDSLEGDVKVEKYPWDGVVYGPHEKKDLSDCDYLVKHRLLSKEKVKQMYPDKAEEIENDFAFYALTDPQSREVDYEDDMYDHAEVMDHIPMTYAQEPMVDVYKKRFRLMECWRRVHEKTSVLVHAEDDFYYNAIGWSKSDVNRVLTMGVFNAIPRVNKRIRITRTVGNVIVSDEYPADLPDNDFYVVPLYGKKRKNRWYGKVLPVIDAQREVNKRRSQMIDIGNKMAAYGWFYDNMTFPDNVKEKFKKISSSPGFTIEVNDTGRLPQRVEGVKFPGELVNLMQISEEGLLNSMSAITESGGANESNSKLLFRANQKRASNEFLFENLRNAEIKIGRLLLGLIQRYYPAERIARMILNTKLEEGASIDGQPAQDFTEDDIIQAVEGKDLLRYDVVVSQEQWSPSSRTGTFLVMQEMAQSGFPIPPEMLIDLAPVPERVKTKALDTLAQQSEAEAQAGDVQAQAEVDKTLIAKGIITPEMSERLGIGQQQSLPAEQNGTFPGQQPLPGPEAQPTPGNVPQAAPQDAGPKRVRVYPPNPDGSRDVEVI